MEIGEVYDVVSLFSTPRRDFLIRNNGEKVKVDSLEGKIVAIYFVSLVEKSIFFFPKNKLEVTMTLKEVYDDLSPGNNFEVVLVADVIDEDVIEDIKLFDKLFSSMPWLAIPQDDKESRRWLFSMLGSESPPSCTILDDRGKVLNTDAISDLAVYGAECYPFTPERIVEIREDDILARASMSVHRLLTDFLIRSDFEMVPVSELEEKVVAFYFYAGCETSPGLDELIELHEKLRWMGKQFEIVFINLRHNNEDVRRLFMEDFRRTSCLRLPSNNRLYLKLRRIFGCQLVIFRPGEKLPDTYGWDIIDRYGIEAYPFTRQRVTEIEVERLKSLTLESILFSGDCKYIKGRGGEQITAHHLENKTILFLFTRKNSSACRHLMPRLITWYNETKKTGKEDLEIIHISCNYDPAKECCYGNMPWLQFPYDSKYSQNMFGKTFNLLHRDMPAIVAFGPDGKILARNVHLNFLSEEWESKIEYPFTFSDVDFFLEVERTVAVKMRWPVPSDEYAEMQRQVKAIGDEMRRQLRAIGDEMQQMHLEAIGDDE